MIVTVASQGESITFQWLGASAQWDDFQKSGELRDWITKSNAILPKQGKGGEKNRTLCVALGTAPFDSGFTQVAHERRM